MMRIKSALQTFLRLFSDPQIYLELLAQPWALTLGLVLTVTSLVGLVIGLQDVRQWGAQVVATPQHISDEWLTAYPNDLVIKWQNQTLTLDPSPSQPITLPWPQALAGFKWAGPLAIYDPSSETQPAEVAKNLPHPPLFVINQHKLFPLDQDGEWTKSLPLTEVSLLPEGAKNWDKATVVTELGQSVAAARHWLKIMVAAWPVLTVLSLWWERGWFILTQGTFLWALNHLLGWRLSWRRVVKLTALLVPAAEVVSWLGQLLYPHLEWSLFQPAFWLLLMYLSFKFPRELLGLQTKTA